MSRITAAIAALCLSAVSSGAIAQMSDSEPVSFGPRIGKSLPGEVFFTINTITLFAQGPADFSQYEASGFFSGVDGDGPMSLPGILEADELTSFQLTVTAPPIAPLAPPTEIAVFTLDEVDKFSFNLESGDTFFGRGEGITLSGNGLLRLTEPLVPEGALAVASAEVGQTFSGGLGGSTFSENGSPDFSTSAAITVTDVTPVGEVPLPAAGWLLLAGLGGLGAFRSRNRAKG